MKPMDYVNLVWLLIAMSSMIYMCVNMFLSSRQNKKDAAAWKARNDEIQTKFLEYIKVQIGNAKRLGKEPWE